MRVLTRVVGLAGHLFAGGALAGEVVGADHELVVHAGLQVVHVHLLLPRVSPVARRHFVQRVQLVQVLQVVSPVLHLHTQYNTTIDRRFKKFARLRTSLSISYAIISISATIRGKRTSDDLAKLIYRFKNANTDYATLAIDRSFSISESAINSESRNLEATYRAFW